MEASPSRRDFLKTGGLITGLLPFARTLLAAPVSLPDQPGQILRKRLLERRSKIETLHVDYSYQSTSKDDFRNGRNQFFMSLNRIHARIEKPDGILIQILDGESGLNAFVAPDGVVQSVRILETSERARSPRPLDSFLPQLEDKPMTSRGVQNIDGEFCQGILQENKILWISSSGSVVRSVEFFRSADQIEERLHFDDFEELMPEVFFPRFIRVLRYGDPGKVLIERALTVHSVSMNGALPERLFSVREFPGKGEKLDSGLEISTLRQRQLTLPWRR